MGHTAEGDTAIAEPRSSTVSVTRQAGPEIAELNIEATSPARSRLKLAAIIVALCLALFITALDQSITSPATPTIAHELHSSAGFFWIGGAYSLAAAASCSIWVQVSNIWGRKPALLAAAALFFVSSLLAALSNSMEMLIAARALQGTAGGGLGQLVLIAVSDLFSLRVRALFIAVLELVWTVAGGGGPVLGGALSQFASWRYIFWINLPVAGTAFILLLAFLDLHNPQTKFREGIQAIDWFGTLSIIGVTVMLLLGLDFGGTVFPWNSATVICLIVFGGAMILVFCAGEKKLARYPLIPLSVFANWGNVAVIVVGVAHGLLYIAVEFYMPLYTQAVRGASPFESGLLQLPLMLSAAATATVTGIMIHKTGHYTEQMWFGTFLMTIATGLYTTLNAQTPLARFLGFTVLGGVGVGPIFQAPIIAIQASVSQADTASATASFGFIRSIASSLSLIVGGVVLQNGMRQQAGALRTAGLNQTLVDAFSGSEAVANIGIINTIADETQKAAVRHAFAWSLKYMWAMYAAVAGVGAIASLFVKQNALSNEHTETRTGIENMSNKRRAEH